jgi:hypothetical protein
MPIIKLADGAYFVASYSTQTITPAYDTSLTIQALSPVADQEEIQPEPDQREPQGPVPR